MNDSKMLGYGVYIENGPFEKIFTHIQMVNGANLGHLWRICTVTNRKNSQRTLLREFFVSKWFLAPTTTTAQRLFIITKTARKSFSLVVKKPKTNDHDPLSQCDLILEYKVAQLCPKRSHSIFSGKVLVFKLTQNVF